MKQLLDFLPIILFFAAYKLYGIYVATGVLMAATTAQMAILYFIDRKLSTMHKVTLALILIFGTLTLVLQDERFIKWKPTVLYGAMALALAVALWGMRKNVLQLMLAHPGVRAACVSTEKPDVYPDCATVGVEVFGLKEAR